MTLKLGMGHPFGKPQSLKYRFLFPNSLEKILRHSTVGPSVVLTLIEYKLVYL